MRQSALLALFALLLLVDVSLAQPTEQEARAALRKAVDFFHHQVAVRGGYVYQYSSDLAKREGEGVAAADTVWVQPPGTPAVGLAFLRAYQATKEEVCLEAARDAAKCLLAGQLRSGGWQASIEFSEAGRKRWAYRIDPPRRRARNPSSLDDNQTQSVLRFLMSLDAELQFKDQSLHEAVTFGLESLLAAQFPSGGWAQVFEGPAPQDAPVKSASFPETWPRTYPGGDYWRFYTLNDGAMVNAIDVCLLAYDVYGEKKYFDAATKGGDFLLLAQLPEPQPAWAQQYNFEMHPAWARKFEPPSITGGESQRAMDTLLDLYERTGEPKYLTPIPPAVAYLKRSLLPTGKLARFYELKSNKPLYATPELKITYENTNIRPGYSFEVESRLSDIEERYQEIRSRPPLRMQRRPLWTPIPTFSARNRDAAVQSISDLDARGAWVETGRLKYFGKGDPTTKILSSETFAQRLQSIALYINLIHAQAP